MQIGDKAYGRRHVGSGHTALDRLEFEGAEPIEKRRVTLPLHRVAEFGSGRTTNLVSDFPLILRMPSLAVSDSEMSQLGGHGGKNVCGRGIGEIPDKVTWRRDRWAEGGWG